MGRGATGASFLEEALIIAAITLFLTDETSVGSAGSLSIARASATEPEKTGSAPMLL